MSETIRILIICGSLRKGSFNRMVANTLPELCPEGMVFEAAPSFETLPIFNSDLLESDGQPEQAIKMAEAIRKADGVIFVSPEYNFSVPGGLKNVLDWISRMPDQPLQGKPVAIQSAAPGPVGGTRMQYQLRQIMIYLDARVLNKPEIFVTHAKDKVDASSGALTDATSRQFISNQLDAFKTLIMDWQASGRAE